MGCDCHISIRGLVIFAFCHYIIYGLFSVIFVFTNECYPNRHLSDYLFGISGAILIGVSIVGWIFANMKKCQPMRAIMGGLIVLNVFFLVSSTYYYTIARWNDVMVTSIISRFRSPVTHDFPDILWFFLVVFACVNGPLLIFYTIYIANFMCHQWKSHLFTTPYQNNYRPAAFLPTMSVPVAPPYTPPINKNV